MSRLDALYTPKQIDILKNTSKRDWFMLINHGANVQENNIEQRFVLDELIRVRQIANKEGVETPQYILAGATLERLVKRTCRIN